jgi:2-polyprenyl-3-methyl-5-hydroxy-6-metoxy-1,4-benzoquinol methylase
VSLRSQKQHWEDLAAVDPLWAICSEPDARYGRWDLDKFFESGKREIDAVMDRVARLGYPRKQRAALDFGCGIGRLSRALAEPFERVVGLDIAQGMIAKATEANAAFPACRFVLNTTEDLRQFADDEFDLIYSNIVLQHVPSRQTILRYIAEFVRVLSVDGILVFQLPSHIRWRHRLQPRPRLYSLLRAAGVSERVLYDRLHLHPIRMCFVPEREVDDAVARAGGSVIDRATMVTDGRMRSTIYYVVKAQPV